ALARAAMVLDPVGSSVAQLADANRAVVTKPSTRSPRMKQLMGDLPRVGGRFPCRRNPPAGCQLSRTISAGARRAGGALSAAAPLGVGNSKARVHRTPRYRTPEIGIRVRPLHLYCSGRWCG